MLVQVLWSCTFASWTPPPPTFSITFADFFRVYCRFQFFCCSRDLCCCFSFVVMHFAWPGNNKKTTHTHNITKTPPFHCDLILPTLQNFIILAKKCTNAQPKNKNNGGRIFFLCSSVGWLAAADVAPLWYDHFTHKVILFVYFFLLLHSLLLLQLFSYFTFALAIQQKLLSNTQKLVSVFVLFRLFFFCFIQFFVCLSARSFVC